MFHERNLNSRGLETVSTGSRPHPYLLLVLLRCRVTTGLQAGCLVTTGVQASGMPVCLVIGRLLERAPSALPVSSTDPHCPVSGWPVDCSCCAGCT
ncbi:hypothetical protein BaRGS_00038709 [Batillaria attramentaria]|uniref:Uncharacterized protein n=1 Tax=Batillaria attramentaria TaxID=370345 RepID=A0ABD0J4Y6_9CAEN